MSEFLRMQAENSTKAEKYASTFLTYNENILPTASDKLRARMRRRLSASEVLAQNMKESGLSTPEIVRRAEAKGYSISRNTINYILTGQTKNPGLFTIEAIAVAIGKAPEQLAGEFLGLKSDDQSFKGSQFAMLAELYKALTPNQRPKADPLVALLAREFQHIKSQT